MMRASKAIGLAAFTDNDDAQPIGEINTTPLIDVMLVLLIMMILTLPPITHAVLLDMPIVDGKPAKSSEPVTLAIDFDDAMYWNDTPIASEAQLQSMLHALAAQPDHGELRIKANRRARYDTVAKAMAAAQRLGVRRMGFVGNEQFME